MEKVSETDEKKTGVKSKTKKRLLILSIIIVILVLGAVISWIIFGSSTFPITEYISDKSSKTLTYSGYGSRLDVSLSATTDDMNVRIMVDGNTVFEESNTQIVNFNHNMGFGDHAVHIFIENPAIFGFGSTIMVSGKVTISLL